MVLMIAKGGEWRSRQIAGEDLLDGWGGKLYFTAMTPGRSTTGLVARVRGGRPGFSCRITG